MSLLQSDIESLQKGAINFLYIFVDANAKGLSADIMRKRTEQINKLKEVYQKNPGYTFQELVNFVQYGIVARYNKTPAQLLQTIYEAAVIQPASVGNVTDPTVVEKDSQEAAAQRVEALTANVTDSGKTTKKSFWQDAKSVIEWIVALFVKLFGRNDNVTYNPVTGDWTHSNSPTYTSGTSSASGWIPAIVAGGILFTLYSSSKGKKKKNKE
ncbi:MAG: hypothetical protein QM751_12950 [Paludibacteraceae bacterium]